MKDDEKITIHKGKTNIEIPSRLFGKLLNYPPFFNAFILTLILVLFLFLLDVFGFPVLFTAVGVFWNKTTANVVLLIVLAAFLWLVVRRYHSILGRVGGQQ